MRERILCGAALAVVVAFAACGGAQQSGEQGAERGGEDGDDPAAGPEAAGPEGEEAARELMAQWRRQHPDREWIEKEQETHTIVPPADNSDLVGNPQGATYARITERDVALWERETMRLVADGSRVFHSADELGSTIAVSCDMCHPDGSNTHPETYPKFQVQMGRVALLRDMINWCVEQALRGEPFAPDDPKMRALEAYILAQRSGTELGYGRR